MTKKFLILIVLGLMAALTVIVLKPKTHQNQESKNQVKLIHKFLKSVPLVKQTSGEKQFKRLDPKQTGIDLLHPLDLTHPLKRVYDSGFAAGGVALGDINKDGLLDVFFSGGPIKNTLYVQTKSDDGKIRFKNETKKAGVLGSGSWSSGAVMVDIDGDDDLDIYICNYDDKNELFINNGKGQFAEQAEQYALAIHDASLFAAFADYDNDGDLDCYLLTNRYYREGGLPTESPIIQGANGPKLKPGFDRYYRITEKGTKKAKIQAYGRPDYLLQNNGKGKFVDVSEKAGIRGDGLGLSITWCDFNLDGWIDLYVANDGDGVDRLYANNKDGTFKDVAPSALPQTSWFSMGSVAGDINNDGQLDLFVVDMSSADHYKQKTTMGVMNEKRLQEVAGPPQQIMRNALFINSGTGYFREAAYLSGLADSDWSWSPKLADFDNDGLLDVFISNGVARNFTDSDIVAAISESKGVAYWDHFEKLAPRAERNIVFRNKGKLSFENVSKQWALDHEGMSYATATGDLDNDGDMDLVVVNLDETVSVYQNQSESSNRVVIQLKGNKANRCGLGALVAIRTQSGWQMRQLNPMMGFLSSNDPRVHFGLGKDTKIELLFIQWPGGVVQTFADLPSNQLYTVTQSFQNSLHSNQAFEPPFGWPRKPLLKQTPTNIKLEHIENKTNDFLKQPLLPNQLSRFGPSVSVGDINGDGWEDLYLSGAAGQPGQVVLNQKGKFKITIQQALSKDKKSEDMGSLLFDADGDDDLDLYVVSGGYEFSKGDKSLRDRLYLNDGKGRFSSSPISALPSTFESGSCIVAGDFDRDGDLDLFVGGRLVPGRYPLSPKSFLLRNDSTPEKVKFVDVTDELAQGLSEGGMVTGALWSDANGDGWLDLLISYEWGTIKIYLNHQGELKDHTVLSGLSQWKGWWNGISGRDIDGDGDIDYVVTNVGLNSKYEASIEKPVSLYYGMFDDSGKEKLIEAEYEKQKLFPIRGKSCSTQAMPHLKNLFPSYSKFAAAELVEIYPKEKLDDAKRYEANFLQSAILLNDGFGNFKIRALPMIAQLAPAFSSIWTELNGDGRPDLVLAQNFSFPQAETGPMNGSLSQVLLGKGDGSFEPLKPMKSGLIVPGDARSLVLADFNRDQSPELLLGLNNNAVNLFAYQGNAKNRLIKIVLVGLVKNRKAIGAKLSVVLNNGHKQTAEIYAGSGYLSQSSSELYFAVPAKNEIETINVRWPNGVATRHKIDKYHKRIVIKYKQ